jgi:uncharacterized membrane protein YraQ (UPF0718 family)
MDPAVFSMVTVLLLLVLWAAARDPALPLQGVRCGLRLLQEVWLPLLLGFAIAGFFEILVPREVLLAWMSEGAGSKGILVAWLVGLCLPGGPYVTFPIAATLANQGIGVGPLITFVTAKLLLSPLRAVSWELPFLGEAFVVARNVPSLFVPPVVGILGERLYKALSHP